MESAADHPLFAAIRSGASMDAIRPYITSASVHQLNDIAQTPLQVAACMGRLDVVQELLKQPNSATFLNKKDINGNTALHCAAGADAEQSSLVLRALFDANIHVNDGNVDGDTALHIASRAGRSENVKTLLSNPEVLQSLKNNNGQTAANVAANDLVRAMFMIGPNNTTVPDVLESEAPVETPLELSPNIANEELREKNDVASEESPIELVAETPVVTVETPMMNDMEHVEVAEVADMENAKVDSEEVADAIAEVAKVPPVNEKMAEAEMPAVVEMAKETPTKIVTPTAPVEGPKAITNISVFDTTQFDQPFKTPMRIATLAEFKTSPPADAKSAVMLVTHKTDMKQAASVDMIQSKLSAANIIAINYSAAQLLLKHRNSLNADLKSHLYYDPVESYESLDDILPEQVAFLLLFNHLLFVAATQNIDDVQYVSTFAEKYEFISRALEDKKPFFKDDELESVWNTIQSMYVKDRKKSFADIKGYIIAGPTRVAKYFLTARMMIEGKPVAENENNSVRGFNTYSLPNYNEPVAPAAEPVAPVAPAVVPEPPTPAVAQNPEAVRNTPEPAAVPSIMATTTNGSEATASSSARVGGAYRRRTLKRRLRGSTKRHNGKKLN